MDITKSVYTYKEAIKLVHPDLNPGVKNPAEKLKELKENKNNTDKIYELLVFWNIIEDIRKKEQEKTKKEQERIKSLSKTDEEIKIEKAKILFTYLMNLEYTSEGTRGAFIKYKKDLQQLMQQAYDIDGIDLRKHAIWDKVKHEGIEIKSIVPFVYPTPEKQEKLEYNGVLDEWTKVRYLFENDYITHEEIKEMCINLQKRLNYLFKTGKVNTHSKKKSIVKIHRKPYEASENIVHYNEQYNILSLPIWYNNKYYYVGYVQLPKDNKHL